MSDVAETFVVRHIYSSQMKELQIICAALLLCHLALCLLMTTAAWRMMVRTARRSLMTSAAVPMGLARMLWMYVLACYASGQRSHENFTGACAGMHIKAYDTQRVPKDQERRGTFHEHLSHTTCKDTNLCRNCKSDVLSDICSIFDDNASNLTRN